MTETPPPTLNAAIELLQEAHSSVVGLEMMAGKPDKEGDSIANKNIIRALAILESYATAEKDLAKRLKEARCLMGYVPFWAKMATQDEGGTQMTELSDAKSIIESIIVELEDASDGSKTREKTE